MTMAINIRPTSMDISNAPVLEIGNLAVGYRGSDGFQRVVHEVSLLVRPGEVVALVGESGSGKTTTAQAVIGLLAENGRLESGAVRLNGTDIAGWSQKQLDTIRGSKISLIPQDPTTSLNPVKTIGAQVAEVLQIHRQGSRAEIDARVIELLARVGLSQPDLRAKQYPHELSGGMRQRVGLARALAVDADVLLMDEPFSAVDEQTRRKFQEDLLRLVAVEKKTFIFVTHSIEEAVYVSDRVVLLSRQPGRVWREIETSLGSQGHPDEIRRSRHYLDVVDEIWQLLKQYVE